VLGDPHSLHRPHGGDGASALALLHLPIGVAAAALRRAISSRSFPLSTAGVLSMECLELRVTSQSLGALGDLGGVPLLFGSPLGFPRRCVDVGTGSGAETSQKR